MRIALELDPKDRYFSNSLWFSSINVATGSWRSHLQKVRTDTAEADSVVSKRATVDCDIRDLYGYWA